MTKNQCISRRDMIAASVFAVSGLVVAGADEAKAEELSLNLGSDTLDFTYIDCSEIKVGDTQNVVIGLIGYSDFESAKLILHNSESGSDIEYDLTNSAGSSVLFTFAPVDAGTYAISSLAFVCAGSDHFLDFSNGDQDCLSFTVSYGTSTMSLGEGDSSSSETTLQVLAEDSSGEISEHATIEEGAALASSIAAAANSRSVKSGPVIVALDPGHYGRDSGTTYPGRINEATCNWKIAKACKAALDTYDNVRAVLTVAENQKIPVSTAREELLWRVQQAVNANANVLVSIHINSSGNGGGYGAEVWAPYDGSYNNQTHTVGEALGNRIIAELEKLGLHNRGVKFRKITDDSSYDYADGSDGDYYGIIRYARQQGLPAIIVEHAFLDNYGDYSQFLSNDSKLAALGRADAQGIVNYYGLTINAAPGTVYRLYNHYDGTHHYTTDRNEYITLGGLAWTQEGIAWVSPLAGESSIPVYRLYNPGSGDHHFTMDVNEYRTLPRFGWKQEGIAWYSDEAKTVPVYRLFNPHATVGTHHYTRDVNEYRTLPNHAWKQEGVCWYAKSAN